MCDPDSLLWMEMTLLTYLSLLFIKPMAIKIAVHSKITLNHFPHGSMCISIPDSSFVASSGQLLVLGNPTSVLTHAFETSLHSEALKSHSSPTRFQLH